MVLAHREELLTQAQKTFTDLGLTAEIEQADKVASPDCKVVVASVQTLKNGRLSKFNPSDFDLLIIDECHHSNAPSYMNLIAYFKHANVVGFTATPYRSDKQSLLDVFEDGMVFDMGLNELIEKGYLTPLSVVKEEIPSRFAPEHIVEAYNKHARDLKTVVFCKDVLHSLEVANEFNLAGVTASTIHGEMSKEDRTEALTHFADGTIKVLTNCNVLTEGFDEPSIQCVILARKTSSRALYEQMVGRGTRLHENKKDLKVVQLVRGFAFPSTTDNVIFQDNTQDIVDISQNKPSKLSRLWYWFKKLVLITLLIALGLFAWKIYRAFSTSDVEPTKEQEVEIKKVERYTVNSTCNLRAEPSVKSRKIMKVGPMDLLIKIEEKTTHKLTWTKVRVGDTTGWCGCPLEKGMYNVNRSE